MLQRHPDHEQRHARGPVPRARQTLAYMLPVLSLAIQRAEAEALALAADGRPHEAGSLQAVVCAPSRELAMQIVRVAHGLLPPDARGCVQQCIGGANPHRQARRPEAGAGPRGAAPRGRAHSGVWRALGRDARGRAASLLWACGSACTQLTATTAIGAGATQHSGACPSQLPHAMLATPCHPTCSVGGGRGAGTRARPAQRRADAGARSNPIPYAAAQAEAVKLNRPLLVVGTPGRLAEMSRMGVLQTHPTRILVLDEARAARGRPLGALQEPWRWRACLPLGSQDRVRVGQGVKGRGRARRWTSCWRCSSRRT
jgi:hypothetical protein